MNNKPETASTLPVIIRFFLWALVWSGVVALVGSVAYLSTFSPSSSLYENMRLRTVVVDVALLLTGLLITSGLVAFAEWRPEQTSWSREFLLSWRIRHTSASTRSEAAKVKEEIEMWEKDKRDKFLLEELQTQRDSLRDEVKGVFR